MWRKHSPAFSMTEMIVMIAILAILAGLLLPALARAREEARKAQCKANCMQVGRAIHAYTTNNDEFLPFAWGPGGVKPEETWAAKAGYAAPIQAAYTAPLLTKDALTSIGRLYPEYIMDAKIFRCPSTEAAPSFLVNGPADGKGWPKYRWSNRQYTLAHSSYGFDCRVSGRVPPIHAIYGDMDGTYQVNKNTSLQNHADGDNVLYMDGHVTWMPVNFGSNDPNDNIYFENNWHADTDSFISDNTDTLKPTNNDPIVVNLDPKRSGYPNLMKP